MQRKSGYRNINVGFMVIVAQQKKNNFMTRYHPDPCKVVRVDGTEVTVITKERKYLRRNKSHLKKIPRLTEDDEEDEDDSDSDKSARPAINRDAPGNMMNEPINSNEGIPNQDLRRSTRTRTNPERYGFPVPTDIVT